MNIRTGIVSLLIALIAVAGFAAAIGPPQVLVETSTNGPAVVFGPGSTLLLAWTGTGNTRLNFQRRVGAVWAAKLVTGETSPFAPALAFFNGRYYVAWTGTGNARLNVMSSANGIAWGGKVTLGETSTSGPALAAFQGRLYLSWRGVGNDRVNVINSPNGSVFGGKVEIGRAHV